MELPNRWTQRDYQLLLHVAKYLEVEGHCGVEVAPEIVELPELTSDRGRRGRRWQAKDEKMRGAHRERTKAGRKVDGNLLASIARRLQRSPVDSGCVRGQRPRVLMADQKGTV